jgi:hypothetical protein
MQHIHPLKEYKRNLIIRWFEQGESNEEIAQLTKFSLRC